MDLMMPEQCTLLAQHGLPVVVTQALDDTKLPSTARLMMWHLRLRLDLVEYREVYAVSIASEMRIREETAGRLLTLLVERGYLKRRNTRGRARAYCLPWSRGAGTDRSRAA